MSRERDFAAVCRAAEALGKASTEKTFRKAHARLQQALDAYGPDETKLRRELAVQVIDLGYRTLATRLHPDRGGSTEAMARLNRARDVLRTHARRLP
jgi:hypothetical protein